MVEASIFGSECAEIKNAVDIIEALCYKFCMFGVIIDGLKNIFCDNGAVCANMKHLESTLTNKHHIISYHRIQESVAAGTFIVSKEHTLKNISYVFTNTMVEPRR